MCCCSLPHSASHFRPLTPRHRTARLPQHYVGTYMHGRREGRGRWSRASASLRYEGEFHAGRRHGVGVLTTARTRYTGGFVGGERAGRGRLEVLASGRVVYDGDFAGNRPHGRGVMTYEDGSRYEGVSSRREIDRGVCVCV